MSRRSITVLILLLAAATTAWVQTSGAPPPSQARYLPAGALLTLEARDFGALAGLWNQSPEKQAWLASPNYQDFSRSKLFLRLSEAQTEYAAAAGLNPDWGFFESIAGGETALGLYDIGSLRFVYVTELARARALETALWQSRASFEPRRAADQEYFVRADPGSGREAAFAVVDSLLVLSTSSELTAQTLALIAGGDGSVTGDDWYQGATGDAGPRGVLRLAYDIQGLARTPHFRSYWIQENVSSLRAYQSGVSDLEITNDGLRERRRILRADAADERAAPSGVLAGLAPDDAGFYRSWTTADPSEAVELLRDKLLATPSGGYGSPYDYAPPPPSAGDQAGSEAALETRIDVAPARAVRSEFDPLPIADVVHAAGLRAALLVESSDASGDFVRRETAVALLGGSEWDAQAAMAAVRASAADLWTVQAVGAGWTDRGAFSSMDGLRSLHLAVSGDLLIVSDSVRLLGQIVARAADASEQSEPVVYQASFRHGREAQSYRALMTQIDFLSGGGAPLAQRSPFLFSENIAGLSEALARLDTVDIVRYDRGAWIEETVDYLAAE